LVQVAAERGMKGGLCPATEEGENQKWGALCCWLKEEKKMVSGSLGEKMKATGGAAFSSFFFCRRAVSGRLEWGRRKVLLMGGRLLFCLARLGRDEF
jgi:hypothetical protein